jgi:hypothetical protein
MLYQRSGRWKNVGACIIMRSLPLFLAVSVLLVLVLLIIVIGGGIALLKAIRVHMNVKKPAFVSST